MFRTFEKYLEQLGERRGMLLLAAILIWVSILLAVYAYGLGMGIIAIGRLSQNAYEALREIAADRAYGGDRWAIFMGFLAWALLLLLIFPLRAARRVWKTHRREQMLAQKALTQVEERLYPAMTWVCDQKTVDKETDEQRSGLFWPLFRYIQVQAWHQTLPQQTRIDNLKPWLWKLRKRSNCFPNSIKDMKP